MQIGDDFLKLVGFATASLLILAGMLPVAVEAYRRILVQMYDSELAVLEAKERVAQAQKAGIQVVG